MFSLDFWSRYIPHNYGFGVERVSKNARQKIPGHGIKLVWQILDFDISLSLEFELIFTYQWCIQNVQEEGA